MTDPEFKEGDIVIVRPNSKMFRQYGDRDYKVKGLLPNGSYNLSYEVIDHTSDEEKIRYWYRALHSRYLIIKPTSESVWNDLDLLEKKLQDEKETSAY